MSSPTYLATDMFDPYWSFVIIGCLETAGFEEFPLDDKLKEYAKQLGVQREAFIAAVQQWTGFQDSVMDRAEERAPWFGTKRVPYYTRDGVVAELSMMLGGWDDELDSGFAPTQAKLARGLCNEASKLVSALLVAMFENRRIGRTSLGSFGRTTDSRRINDIVGVQVVSLREPWLDAAHESPPSRLCEGPTGGDCRHVFIRRRRAVSTG